MLEDGQIDVVLIRHCDGLESNRHCNYWEMPCTGLFRAHNAGLDWCCDNEPPTIEKVMTAIKKEALSLTVKGLLGQR